MQNSLLHTLKGLRGNPRACVFTEPLWGLSMNLCLPYASAFMLAVGLTDKQVGATASIYMFSQMVFSLLSGVITDKLGRRLVTFLFDFFAWSIPCLIWASSQGFWFFAAAAMFNGVMKVPTVAWSCLLVEDAENDKIAHIYAWILIAGNLSALFAPIASILISRMTLAPAARILYINALIVMTAKMVILYAFSTETKRGVERMRETRGVKVRTLLAGYIGVAGKVLKSKGMLFAILISVLAEAVTMINMNFWPIITSQRLGIDDKYLPLYPMLRSIMAIVFFFTIISRINQSRLKSPLVAGYFCSIVGFLILLVLPRGRAAYIGLIASLVFESLGTALWGTVRETVAALHTDPGERSRITAILHTVVMLVCIPFGYVAGLLSEVSRLLPFALNIVLLLAGVCAASVFYRGQGGAVGISDQ